MKEKITTKKIREKKKKEEKITMLTAYDYPTAKILDEAGIDVILVGDSIGTTVLGYKNTLPVTMEEMLTHTKAVSRATDRSLLIGDMPFLSYQSSVEKAIENAGRFLKEAEAEAVKVEGGKEVLKQVKGIVNAGIPVAGHLGLTPQKIHQFGGYQPRGMKAEEAKQIIEDAKKLEKAGVFCIILESVPSEIGKIITEKLDIPTIGIGAGPHCDGQVLVIHDILGLSEFSPKFSKKYKDLSSSIKEAVDNFKSETENGEFPSPENTYSLEEEELENLKGFMEKED